jgi:hypothetical protein
LGSAHSGAGGLRTAGLAGAAVAVALAVLASLAIGARSMPLATARHGRLRFDGSADAVTVRASVLLGDGVSLFDRPGGANVRLERIGPTQVPHATNVWMRVAGRACVMGA